MRVLYVCMTSARGGSARSLRFLIEAFPPGRVEAHVLCPPGPAVEEFRAAGAAVHVSPGVSHFPLVAGAPIRGLRWLVLLRSLWNLRYGNDVLRAIRAAKPDLVHLNDHGMWQATSFAFRLGLPIVTHARSVCDRGNGFLKAINERVLKTRSAAVIAIDESVRRGIREVPGVRVVYNPAKAPREVERVPSDRVRVTFMSGLLDGKGLWDLLEAARLLRERKDVEFRIYGDNPRPAAFYASWAGRMSGLLGFSRDNAGEARRWAAERGLEATVKFLGHVDAEKGPYAETDVLAFPSHLDALGRSVFEAGMRGIPSVVALATRIDDIVKDGETGLVVPPKDPAALAAAIGRLAGDAELRRRLGEAARARFVKQFDPGRAAAAVLSVYEAVSR